MENQNPQLNTDRWSSFKLEEPEWKKYKGDIRHCIKLAAKKSGKNEEESKQIEYAFSLSCTDEKDIKKLNELAIKYCKNNNLPDPELPILPATDKNTKQIKKNVKEKKETENVEGLSFIETDDAIYEQFYIKNKRIAGYLRFDKKTKEITDEEEVIYNGIKYQPRLGEELDVHAVILPENIEQYGTTKELLYEIQSFIEKYVDVPEQYRIYASYYILLSWVYDRFNTINYLRVRGDLGQGKTRFLQTVGQLCYKPMIVSGALGAAPVFRILSRWGGTLVMDESDFNNSDETDQLVKVLNVGYQKGMCVMRCDKNNPNKLDFFKVYGPKVISSRKVFDDQALESRCLSHEMYRTKRKNIPDILTNDFEKEQMTLRNKLLLFRFNNYLKIDSDNINTLNLGDEIEPRLRQATRAFVALLSEDEIMVEDFKKFLKSYNRKLIAERSTSIDGMIVRGVALLLDMEMQDISSKDIMDILSQTGDLWDRANNRSIGKRLSALGIQTRDKRIVTKELKNAVRNCIDWKTFDISLFDRYLSDEETKSKAKQVASNFVACSVLNNCIDDTLHAKNEPKTAKSGVCSVTPPAHNISRYKRYTLQIENWQELPIQVKIQHILKEVLNDANGQMVEIQEIVDNLKIEFGEIVNENIIQDRIDTLKEIGYIYEPKRGKIALVNIEEKV